MALGLVLDPVLRTSTLIRVFRSNASTRAQTASTQKSLSDTQSTAMSSVNREKTRKFAHTWPSDFQLVSIFAASYFLTNNKDAFINNNLSIWTIHIGTINLCTSYIGPEYLRVPALRTCGSKHIQNNTQFLTQSERPHRCFSRQAHFEQHHCHSR